MRPAVVLPVIATIVVIVALLTPEQQAGRTGDPRLSSFSSQPLGARALYELADRLGWQVERRLDDSTLVGDPRVIQMVLAPPAPPTALQTHELLEGVRQGGALLYVMSDRGGPLTDSLGLKRSTSGVLNVRQPGEAQAECRAGTGGLLAGGLPLWPDGRVHLWAVRWENWVTMPGRVRFGLLDDLPGSDSTDASSVAAGYELGRGRVVVVADPDLLRNDVLRVCRWGADVIAVRMLEYLSAGAPDGQRRRRVAFDEYHQGYGEQPGTVRAIVAFVSRTAPGHVVLQLAGAGLLLLVALGPRALPPRDVERVERRSPLEHVDALAHAYQRVGATRTAVARLLHGVRRRTERVVGASGDASDDGFLAAAQARVPARADDIAVIRHALHTPVARRELEHVGEALRRLESSLTATPR